MMEQDKHNTLEWLNTRNEHGTQTDKGDHKTQSQVKDTISPKSDLDHLPGLDQTSYDRSLNGIKTLDVSKYEALRSWISQALALALIHIRLYTDLSYHCVNYSSLDQTHYTHDNHNGELELLKEIISEFNCGIIGCLATIKRVWHVIE